MTDCELLELAAKAAGIKICHTWPSDVGKAWSSVWGKDWAGRLTTRLWNPLGNDGDALRLAVKLSIKLRWHAVLNQALVWPCSLERLMEVTENGEDHCGDPYAATRRAIVRAAAEIGKAMP